MEAKLTVIDADRKTELSNCVFVKTALMLLVVLYHCMVFWTGTWFTGDPIYTSSLLAYISRWLNSFHIYAFVLVSGYLFAYLKYENGKYTKFSNLLILKTKRLLIPYIFVAVAWVIPFALYYFDYNFCDIAKRFFLGTSPNQLWFLLMLFGVFLLFYPVSNFVKKHEFLGVVVMLGFYGVGLVGLIPNLFQILRACMYMPMFWIGFKLRQWGTDRMKRIPPLFWLIAHVLLFVLVQYFAQFSGFVSTLVQKGLDLVLHSMGALMAFVVLQRVADKVYWRENRFFGFISKLSMPVYLVHQQVIYVFIYLLNGRLNPYIHAMVNFIGAMVVSLTISKLLIKFRTTRFLIGEK